MKITKRALKELIKRVYKEETEYQSFFNKPYPQNSKTFVPNLSIIDMLANIGPKSKNFLIEWTNS